MTTKRPIYMAYGSNLNIGQMRMRCPKAKNLGFVLIPDYRLVFRGVADMIKDKGAYCPIGLWEITEDCEKALDIYEGFPSLYRKEYLKDRDTGQGYMYYAMNRDGLSMPPKGYLDTIKQGYNDFGINHKWLTEALEFTQEYDSDDGYIPKRYRKA